MRLQSEVDPLYPLASCLLADSSVSAATHLGADHRPDAGGVIVEVDRGSASSGGRHPDRAFMIRFRWGDQSVIVTVGLWEVAAGSLADHIADVIGGSRPLVATEP